MAVVSEKPTLRAVAQLAGVSLGTASQALSNKPNVLPETRAKVLEAAAALGYQPQTRVQLPAAVNLSTMGLLMKSDDGGHSAFNPFYSYILAGVERECQRQNITLMYAHLETDSDNRALSWPPMLSDQRLDGLIIVGTFLEATIAEISRKSSQAIVLVDAYAPGQNFDSIVTDNVNSAQTAVEYLISQGHRHIGLVGSTADSYPSIRERRKGYTRALKENGINDIYIEDSSLNRDGGYEATLKLLRRAPQITAIFGCNDNAASGAISAAYTLGLKVPDDLSVVGFDDIDLAQELIPALTTMHVDKVLMGALAVRQLRERAENPLRPALTIALSTQLIVRQSVRDIS